MITAETVQKSFVVQHSIAPVCSNCKQYDRGVCRLRAEADWGDAAFVRADKKACFLAEMHPF